ncbi:class I SAM-dependent methyltransferase [Pallidibacillus pasinlerensis]|uniref:Class I SAM-dependent methyltransferase n=1 Tax=Pallidibacillus pasinlerensis TaxID=2703818 RepID=A0ABX0A0S9_9BACI|nr:class I SAM-dependent methyltransferase [Pallidibacillus pasinlerensis]NCU17013.1 class I SAM-dependent methyltransferase [Pallidibacillus pasinlerensis]
MQRTDVEKLFQLFDETANLLANDLNCTYLEALAETGENIFHDKVLQEDVSEVTRKRLDKYYFEASKQTFVKEDVRKAFQLAVLKGMRQNVQPNHQMTPDSIGMLVSFILEKFMADTKSFTLLDPAIGTANLVTTIMNYMHDYEIRAYGVDIDDVLIQLAYVSANLQEHTIELHNQDSFEDLLIDPVDVVVSDLPVGYYPDDMRAREFKLKADKGHSYAHHLFIEQSTRYTKDGGYLFFIVPNNIFQSPEAPKLQNFIKEHLHIQAFLQLPESMFKNKNAAKSILVLQKQADGVKPPQEVLLANLPSLTDKDQMETILAKIDLWVQENKK